MKKAMSKSIEEVVDNKEERKGQKDIFLQITSQRRRQQVQQVVKVSLGGPMKYTSECPWSIL
jgi:hypothetical protein